MKPPKFIFISISVSLLILKAYATGMGWSEIGVAILLSAVLGFVMWKFRKKIVQVINELCEAIFDGPSLLPLVVTAMVILYTVLLLGSPAMNSVLVAGVLTVHLVNILSHTSFCKGSMSTLCLGLLFQVLSVFAYANMSTMTAIVIANYTALILLSRRFSYEKNIGTNRTYAILSYVILSALIVLHPYSLAHILVEAMMVMYDLDTIGWSALLTAAYPVMAAVLAGALVFLFFTCGGKQVKNRPSATFSLIGLWYLLFSNWESYVVSALFFSVLVSYLVFERRYYSLEDLIGMDAVSDSLERKVINEFATKVSSVQDLAPLEEYLYHHSKSLYAWNVYLHLARPLMDCEIYDRVVRIAERGLEKSEDEILLPEPTWIYQE